MLYVVDDVDTRCLGAWTVAFKLLLHDLGTVSLERTAKSFTFVYADLIILCARSQVFRLETILLFSLDSALFWAITIYKPLPPVPPSTT